MSWLRRGPRREDQPREETWLVAPQRPDDVAIEISADELRKVEALLREAWGIMCGSVSGPSGESPVPQMMQAWHKRLGAAAAVAHRDGVEPDGRLAFLASEIESVANAVQRIDPYAGSQARQENRDFLASLHARLGYAEVVQHVAGHAVVPRELGR